MSQDWTDDLYDSTHQVLADMAQIEDNFAALKSAFSGTSAPANPVAGMWWLDTTNHILKVYGESSAWLSVWDFANNKPVVANLLYSDFPAALKDGTAANQTLRSLGTGAAQACAGNDSRLSDTRTPTDGSVTAAKLEAYASGNYILVDSGWISQPISGSYTKRWGGRMPVGGTVKTKVYRKNDTYSGDSTEDIASWSAGDIIELYGKSIEGGYIYAKVYKNGVAVGTERTSTYATNGYIRLIIAAATPLAPIPSDITYAPA